MKRVLWSVFVGAFVASNLIVADTIICDKWQRLCPPVRHRQREADSGPLSDQLLDIRIELDRCQINLRHAQDAMAICSLFDAQRCSCQ